MVSLARVVQMPMWAAALLLGMTLTAPSLADQPVDFGNQDPAQAAQQLMSENFANADLLAQMSIEVKYMDHVRKELVEQELERVARG